MKKIILTLCAALFSFTVFAADNFLPAIMMQPSGGLFVEKDDTMEWKQSLETGTEIKVITLMDENGNLVPETKKSKRTVDKKLVDCTMYHVMYENQKFWVLTDRISINETFAALKAPAAVYRSPDVVDVKDVALPLCDWITVGKIFNANGMFEMYKISYYDSKNYEVRTGYVMANKVTTDEKDFKAIRLIEKLKTAKDKAVRDELYSNIKKLKISQEILDYADMVVDPLFSIPVEDFYAGAYIYNEDTSSPINVREYPGTGFDVVGSIADEYIYAQCTRRTSKTYKIGDSTNYWYEVTVEGKETITGWIFGDFIVFGE